MLESVIELDEDLEKIKMFLYHRGFTIKIWQYLLHGSLNLLGRALFKVGALKTGGKEQLDKQNVWLKTNLNCTKQELPWLLFLLLCFSFFLCVSLLLCSNLLCFCFSFCFVFPFSYVFVFCFALFCLRAFLFSNVQCYNYTQKIHYYYRLWKFWNRRRAGNTHRAWKIWRKE